MSKVDTEDTLLKRYSDKELIAFIASNINVILRREDGYSNTETDLAVRIADIERYASLLSAVNARMNKGSNDPTIML